MITDNKKKLITFAEKLANFSIANTEKYSDLVFSPYRYPELSEALLLLDYQKKLRKYIDDVELGTIHPLRYGRLYNYYKTTSENINHLAKNWITTKFNIEEIVSLQKEIDFLLSDYEKSINEYGRKLIDIIKNNRGK